MIEKDDKDERNKYGNQLLNILLTKSPISLDSTLLGNLKVMPEPSEANKHNCDISGECLFESAHESGNTSSNYRYSYSSRYDTDYTCKLTNEELIIIYNSVLLERREELENEIIDVRTKQFDKITIGSSKISEKEKEKDKAVSTTTIGAKFMPDKINFIPELIKPDNTSQLYYIYSPESHYWSQQVNISGSIDIGNNYSYSSSVSMHYVSNEKLKQEENKSELKVTL